MPLSTQIIARNCSVFEPTHPQKSVMFGLREVLLDPLVVSNLSEVFESQIPNLASTQKHVCAKIYSIYVT